MTVMVKVETLCPHKNRHGDKVQKNLRKRYELPEGEAKSLAKLGIVKILDGEAEDDGAGE